MLEQECKYIRELLPLHAEGLVSPEAAAAIEAHLAECPECRQEWAFLQKTLPDPLGQQAQDFPAKKLEMKILFKLKKTAVLAVLLLVAGGAGLAYASYNAGKHIGLYDPAWRFAQELGLFTEINETKSLGQMQATLDQGLFDATRSVVFVSLSEQGAGMPQVSLSDEDGTIYEQRGGRGWQNQYFMLEFEPLSLESEQVHLNLAMEEEGAAEFTFPVDMVKTAQYTTIVYPNQVRELPGLKITLEKAVLSVSESEYRLRYDWPLDYSVAALGVGKGAAYFPTSIEEAPALPSAGAIAPGGLRSGYAAVVGLGFRPEQPPGERPVLYDMTAKQEAAADMGEFRTTEFPCQVEAILKFAPVPQESKELELVTPSIWLYQEVPGKPSLELDFTQAAELVPAASLPVSSGRVLIEKAWLEDQILNLQYSMEALEQPETLLPHFELTDAEGNKKGTARFDTEKKNVVVFYLYDKEIRRFMLTFDALGYLTAPEKFVLTLD